jgi:hypothetical protein
MCSLEEAFPNTDGSSKKKKAPKKRMELLPPPETNLVDRSGITAPSPPEPLGGEREEWTPETSASEASWADFANAPDPDYFHPDSYMLKAPEWADHDWIRRNLPGKDTERRPEPQPWFDSAPTLWQNIPKDWKSGETRDAGSTLQFNRLDELQHRIDSLFARLESVDNARTESNHTEVILFVLGGLFLILILDLIVKQGTQASLFVSAANTPSFTNSFLKGGRRR